MKKLIARVQLPLLEKYLKKFPVVAVVGARQTGKTTLVRDILKQNRAFLSLDDPTNALLAQEDPISFLQQAKRVTVDEIQKVPVLFPAIKRMVDQKRIPGQFLITGSANITMLPAISESLAGRIVFVQMAPFVVKELLGQRKNMPAFMDILRVSSPKKCWEILREIKYRELPLEKFIVRGGLPPAYLEEDNQMRKAWFNGYIRTYLERDVRDISRIRNIYDYQKFLSLLAFRCAQIFKKAEVARDCGIPYTTASHFFDLLLATYQVFLIEPYYRNIGKRLIKAPKVMWADTGLAMHLQGLQSWRDAVRLGKEGFLVENKIAIELTTYLSNNVPLAKLFYWRTSGGAEIDFVIKLGGRLIPIEVKWKSSLRTKDITSIQIFLKDFRKNAPWGIVIFKGSQLLKIKGNIFLVPYQLFF